MAHASRRKKVKQNRGRPNNDTGSNHALPRTQIIRTSRRKKCINVSVGHVTLRRFLTFARETSIVPQLRWLTSGEKDVYATRDEQLRAILLAAATFP